MIGNANEPAGLKPYRAIAIRSFGVKYPRLLPQRQPWEPLPMLASSGIRGRKSITVQTVRGLRGYQLRTGYTLRVKRKQELLGIGWRGIVHKVNTVTFWAWGIPKTSQQQLSSTQRSQSAQDPVGDTRII